MARVLFLLILSLLASTGWGAAPVGSLASLEGEVTVLRLGVLIPSEKISDGFPLEAFDTVATGSTGRADVRFSSVGVTGSVRLDPATSVYLDLTSLKKEQAVGLELLTGALSVRLSAVTGSSVVEVRTDLGTFAGRGPQFRVVETAGGDVLVTVASGQVACRLPGRSLFIEPGSVAQVLLLDRSVQTLPVNVSTLDSFESTWVRQRGQALRDQAAVVFRAQALQYQLQLGLGQRAWDRVQRESSDDSAVRAATANLRRAAFPLERSLFRIRALRGLYDNGMLPPTLELSRGYTAKDFFRQFAVDDALWQGRLGEARGLYKALADRSGGTFPKATDGESITHDTDYFH